MAHHDVERKYVSGTARATAAMRYVETNSAAPLFRDEFAEALAGDEGADNDDFLNSVCEKSQVSPRSRSHGSRPLWLIR